MPHRHESDPSSDESPDLGDLGFHWEDEVEVEQFSTEDEASIKRSLVPVRASRSMIDELTVELQNRLEMMKVENAGSVSRRKIRKLPEEIYLAQFAVEDVHYSVYEKKRQKTISPFISITTDEVLSAIPSDISHLQRAQTLTDYLYLADRGLKENRLYRWATSETILGEEAHPPEKKFAIRCLARLLRERALRSFTDKLPEEAYERGAQNPLVFEAVAKRASEVLDRRIRLHEQAERSLRSTDERIWYLLMSRELERAKSFALPLGQVILNQAIKDSKKS